MSKLCVVALIALLSSTSAGAQTAISSKIQTNLAAPTATVTFTPYQLIVPFNGSSIRLMLGRVNLYTPGPVMLSTLQNSNAGFEQEGFANGTYIVRFSFGWNNGPSTAVAIKLGDNVIAQCTLQVQLDFNGPEQNCDSPPIEVTNGLLPVQVVQTLGGSVNLNHITVTLYPPPTLRIR